MKAKVLIVTLRSAWSQLTVSDSVIIQNSLLPCSDDYDVITTLPLSMPPF